MNGGNNNSYIVVNNNNAAQQALHQQNSNVYLAKQIKTDHHDLIQDIAYDFFGKRVATASLDQLVKIWNVKDNNEWEFKEDIKVMPGLYKVAWAHPEFGQLIAIAQDRYVWIYEEVCCGNNKSSQSGWVKRVPAFSDARATVTDIKFAPKQLGLQFIVTTANGEARIYEFVDNVSVMSTVWSLQQEIKTNMDSCSSCSWSTCLNLPVLLAFGSDSTTTNADPVKNTKLAIFEYADMSRGYTKIDISSTICQDAVRSIAFAPSVGKLYHTLAVGSKGLLVLTIKPIKDNYKYQITTAVLDTDISTWRVCWNAVGSVLASAGDDRHVRLWKSNYMGEWKCFAEIIGDACQVRVDQILHEQQYNHNSNQQQQQQIQTQNTFFQHPPPAPPPPPPLQQSQHAQYYQPQLSVASSGLSLNSNSTTAASSLLHSNQHGGSDVLAHYPHGTSENQNTRFYRVGNNNTSVSNPNEVPWH